MYYENIFGWFTFDQTYNKALDKYDNCNFVEIGSFQGRSACNLAENIKAKNKNIKLVCVDLWPNVSELGLFAHEGVGQGEETSQNKKLDKPLMEVFIDHMNAADVRDIIYPIRCESAQAAKLFPDEYFKFIFIDAGHTYQQVYDDMVAWWPKLDKTDGLMGGDDYGNGNDPIYRAVHDFFADKQGLLTNAPSNAWEFQI